MIEITIPGNPTTKKNSRTARTGRTKDGRIYLYQGPSEKFTEYQKAAAPHLVIPPKRKKEFPINYPVNVKCIYYRDSLKRCDLSNLHEATDDILVHYGILKDDNFMIVAGHDGSRVKVDRVNPRTEIFITRMEE